MYMIMAYGLMNDEVTLLLKVNCGKCYKSFFAATDGSSNYSMTYLMRSRQSWSSLDQGNEGSFRTNCQTNLVLVHRELSILFWHFINTKEPNKELHKPVYLDSFVYCKPHSEPLFSNQNFCVSNTPSGAAAAKSVL